jgi:hypothetical protein
MIFKYWRFLRADWRREYRVELMDDLDAGISWTEFSTFLLGLSADAVWRQVTANEPVEMSSEEASSILSRL